MNNRKWSRIIAMLLAVMLVFCDSNVIYAVESMTEAQTEDPAAAQAAAQQSTWTPTASSSSAPTAARRRSSPAKSPSTASTGPYKFSSIPAPLQAVRPRGRFSFLPAKFVENSGFSTVFHTWFLPGSVCGNLGCQKFQRGEAILPQVRNAAENKFSASTFFSKKGSSTPFLSRFSLFSRFGIHRV